MDRGSGKITVFYDGACPKCIKDRKNYEKLAGKYASDVCWFDITGKDSEVRKRGIDPQKAIKELHVADESQKIHKELDAYILLLRKVPVLSPLSWLIGLPIIRPFLSRLYHGQVNYRLRRDHRL